MPNDKKKIERYDVVFFFLIISVSSVDIFLWFSQVGRILSVKGHSRLKTLGTTAQHNINIDIVSGVTETRLRALFLISH